jgi:hypothetical protein
MSDGPADPDGRFAAILLPWICMTLAGTFVDWTLTSSIEELQQPEVGLARYALLLGPAAIGAGLLSAVLFWFNQVQLLAQLSRGLAVVYLSVFKVAGLSFAPPAALGLTVAAVLALRGRSNVSPRLSLILHGMGSLTGFYLAANLHKYTIAWPLLLNVLRSLYQIVAN